MTYNLGEVDAIKTDKERIVLKGKIKEQYKTIDLTGSINLKEIKCPCTDKIQIILDTNSPLCKRMYEKSLANFVADEHYEIGEINGGVEKIVARIRGYCITDCENITEYNKHK